MAPARPIMTARCRQPFRRRAGKPVGNRQWRKRCPRHQAIAAMYASAASVRRFQIGLRLSLTAWSFPAYAD